MATEVLYSIYRVAEPSTLAHQRLGQYIFSQIYVKETYWKPLWVLYIAFSSELVFLRLKLNWASCRFPGHLKNKTMTTLLTAIWMPEDAGHNMSAFLPWVMHHVYHKTCFGNHNIYVFIQSAKPMLRLDTRSEPSTKPSKDSENSMDAIKCQSWLFFVA